MANKPISVIDPDGGCTNKSGRPCEFSVLGGEATDFAGNTWSKILPGDLDLLGQNLPEVFITGNEPSIISKIWNSYAVRAYTGDKLDIGLSIDTFEGFMGFQTNLEATWLLRGPDASIFPYVNTVPNLGTSVGLGADMGASLEFDKGYYLSNNLSELTKESLSGPEFFAGAELDEVGGLSGEISLAVDPTSGKPLWLTGTLGLDVGLGAKIEAGVRQYTN